MGNLKQELNLYYLIARSEFLIIIHVIPAFLKPESKLLDIDSR